MSQDSQKNEGCQTKKCCKMVCYFTKALLAIAVILPYVFIYHMCEKIEDLHEQVEEITEKVTPSTESK